MLRIHCLQLWFDLSDPAVEEALYDSLAMRAFVGIDLGREPVPDETTVMRFRHLLEEHELGEQIFEEVGHVLKQRAAAVQGHHRRRHHHRRAQFDQERRGRARPRDASDQEGQQWHFGMKAHVGVDSQSKVIHAVVVTPANTADCKVMEQLLHGRRRGSTAIRPTRARRAVIRAKAPKAKDFTNRQCKWKHCIDEAIKAKNRTKSRIRARVEHSIGVIKRVFGFTQGALPRAWPRTATGCS